MQTSLHQVHTNLNINSNRGKPRCLPYAIVLVVADDVDCCVLEDCVLSLHQKLRAKPHDGYIDTRFICGVYEWAGVLPTNTD